MTILKIIFYFFTIFFPGYLFISWFLAKEKISIVSKLALAYGLGMFFVTIQLFFYLFIIRQNFVYAFFAWLMIFENIILFYFYWRWRQNNQNITEKKHWSIKVIKKPLILEIIILVLIVVQISFSFINTLSRPVIAFDSMDVWSYKAKVLFYEKNVSFDANDQLLYLGGGRHRNYPWQISLAQFWLHENLGEYNDLLANIIFFTYYLCLLILFFSFLVNKIKRILALAFTFFLTTMPLFFYHSFNAYADMSLAYHVFVSFIFLFLWLEKDKMYLLILSAFFAGLTFLVKDSGIIYLIAYCITLLYVLLKKKKYKEVSFAILALAAPLFAWLFFRYFKNLGISNMETGLVFHPEIYKNVLSDFFAAGSWNIWWYLLIVILTINIKRILKDNNMLIGWLLFITYFIGNLIILIFTEHYISAIQHTAISRNIMAVLPITLCLIGILFNDHKPESKFANINIL